MSASSIGSATGLRERIAAGDRVALGEAFVAYRAFAAREIRHRARLEADVDDIVQETFILLPKSARYCKPTTSLAGCVAAALINAIRSYDCHSATSDQTGAARGKASRRVELDPAELAKLADSSFGPEEVLGMRERAHHLSCLLMKLTKPQREILIAREVNGIGIDELSEHFCIPRYKVLGFTTRARGRLLMLAKRSPLAEVFAAMPRGRRKAA